MILPSFGHAKAHSNEHYITGPLASSWDVFIDKQGTKHAAYRIPPEVNQEC